MNHDEGYGLEFLPGPAPAAIDPAGERLVAAQTDSEIARAYLHHAELATATLKSTRTELGRFLLWCRAQGLTLEGVKVEHLHAYKSWLRDPQPAAEWISATRWPRSDPRWRPFSGPLAESSARQAFRVAKALLDFAADAGYLRRSPARLVKNLRAPKMARVTRYLAPRALDYVHAVLERGPASGAAQGRAWARDRFLFLAYAGTGARLSEIVAARMGDLYREDDGRCWLDVLGKGRKPRRLPVSPALLQAFQAYRLAYGLAPASLHGDVMPLVLNSRGPCGAGVSGEAAARAMKALFAAAAGLAQEQGDADSAAVLRLASPHWLRHSMLTAHANNGVSLKTLQETAGHASLATTAIYLHKEDQQRHDELMAAQERDPRP